MTAGLVCCFNRNVRCNENMLKKNIQDSVFHFSSPLATGQCSKPDLSDNVVLVGATFEEGSTEKLKCDPGYLPKKGMAVVTCQGGKWNPNPQDFTCKSNFTSPCLKWH